VKFSESSKITIAAAALATRSQRNMVEAVQEATKVEMDNLVRDFDKQLTRRARGQTGRVIKAAEPKHPIFKQVNKNHKRARMDRLLNPAKYAKKENERE